MSFFLWIVARGGILTIDNLVKKNLSLVNWCCLCWCDEETVDHLLLYCKFSHCWGRFAKRAKNARLVQNFDP